VNAAPVQPLESVLSDSALDASSAIALLVFAAIFLCSLRAIRAARIAPERS